MDKFIERELKILITKEQFEELLNSYDFNKPIIQVNTYYDTNDRKIKNNKGALRIRKIDDKNIFTLKIRKDEITHLEYEKEINTDDLQDIKDPQILEWLDRFDIPLQLSPITTFKTKRYTLDLVFEIVYPFMHIAAFLGIYMCLVLAKVVQKIEMLAKITAMYGKASFWIMFVHFPVLKIFDWCYTILYVEGDFAQYRNLPVAYTYLWPVYLMLGLGVPMVLYLAGSFLVKRVMLCRK